MDRDKRNRDAAAKTDYTPVDATDVYFCRFVFIYRYFFCQSSYICCSSRIKFF